MGGIDLISKNDFYWKSVENIEEVILENPDFYSWKTAAKLKISLLESQDGIKMLPEYSQHIHDPLLLHAGGDQLSKEYSCLKHSPIICQLCEVLK